MRTDVLNGGAPSIVRNPGAGYQRLVHQPAPPHESTDGGGLRLNLGRSKSLLAIAHLTDLHVIDASSPARAEHVQLRELDPAWWIMLPMHRPYELLVNHAVAAMVETIRAHPISPLGEVPFDVALVTGDCIDNAQLNELEMYFALLTGGTAHLPYDGVQSPAGHLPGFWSPEAALRDDWKDRYGFPVVPHLLEAINRPLTSLGLGSIRTLVVPGNHDVMRQGTAFSSAAMEVFATGDRKTIDLPSGFDPPDKLAAFLADPFTYNESSPTRVVRADSGRRIVSLGEWVSEHRRRGLLFPMPSSASGGDSVVDFDQVRLISLNTNHPAGHYQGSVGRQQLEWLHDRIVETTSWVVLATHHGIASLTNDTESTTIGDSGRGTFGDVGSDDDRLLAEAVAEVLHRHSQVVLWISGHRHHHRIVHQPHPSGANEGFWEITTSSIIDWPSQARAIELVESQPGELVVITTPIDHHAPIQVRHEEAQTDAHLASLHRELAANWGRDQADVMTARAAGSVGDQRRVIRLRSRN